MSKYLVFRMFGFLVGRIAREFEIRKPDSVDGNLIGANSRWRFKSFCSGAGHKVVLVYAIAADAESPDEHTVLVETGTSREKYNSALVARPTGLETLRAGICRIHHVEIEKRPVAGAVDARRKQRHRAKSDCTVGYCGAHRHLIQIGGKAGRTVEVHHVARFGSRYIDAEDGGIGHAAQANNCTVRICNSDYHSRARTFRQPDCRAR